MEKIRELLAKPVVTAALGFVIGLIIGLPILGWWIWPVKWVDAGAKDLRYDSKVDYLRMAADSYALNQDSAAAQRRWKELLPDKASAAQKADVQKALAELQVDSKAAPDLARYGAAVGVVVIPGAAAPQPVEEEKPKEEAKPEEEKPAEEQPAAGEPTATLSPEELLATLSVTPTAEVVGSKKSSSNSLMVLLGVLCGLTLLVGAALVYFVVLKKGKLSLGRPSSRAKDARVEEARPVTVEGEEGQEAPISQFMSTYNLGDDLYDDSFSIDSPGGEFLGECGIGISETIGVGDPKKVTAFEVWLFDKNDIQTVTKVLMSEHAYNDPAMRQRMASKGEPIQIGVGSRILLETATLQLEARVTDMSYGSGALPGGSFFDRMTLELAVWPKK